MTDATLTAAVLIVSDSVASGASEDKSSELLLQLLNGAKSAAWQVLPVALVHDDVPSIRARVQEWISAKTNLILTSGGTGFATRDVTPEAIEAMLEKKAPGLIHAMMASGLEKTPFAMLSRATAGICGASVIVSLPGSPRGASENLEAIIKLLPHACMQAAGYDSRKLHEGGIEKLEQDAGVQQHEHSTHFHGSSSHVHGHGHGHNVPRPHTKPGDGLYHSNDPAAGLSQRYRQSPYQMLSVETAINTILEHCSHLSVVSLPITADLRGYVLAEDISALEPVPAFRASTVDGYAVVMSKDGALARGMYKVAFASQAGSHQVDHMEQNTVVRITTGAPLPPNAAAVVMVEDTKLISTTSDGEDELEIEILTDEIETGENVREIGSDVAAGTTILKAGTLLSRTGGELGLLASVGCRSVKVYKRPIIGVMSTGDEIAPFETPGPLPIGQVRDCNRIVILTALRGWTYECLDLGIAADNAKEIESRLRAAFSQCDVIVTTGGASMGEHDLLKPVIERSLGGTTHFARVSMKPGKPTTFATVELKGSETGVSAKRLLFSLPGNPASAVVTTAVFALPGLRKLSGYLTKPAWPAEGAWRRAGLPRIKVELAESINGDHTREEYVRVSLRSRSDGRLIAETTGGQRSSRIGSIAGANGLAIIPAGAGKLRGGSEVEVLLLSDLI